MKKLISLILTIAMLLGMTTVIADEEIKVYVDGKQVIFDAKPFIENDRTLVPIRAIAEKLGAEVEWDAPTQNIELKIDDVLLQLTIGENTILKDTESIEIDVPAKIADDRTYIPLRAVSEAFDCYVDWKTETKTVTIESPEYAETHYETYTERVMSYLPQDENYVISPLGLNTVMFMAANGTEGETQDEFLSCSSAPTMSLLNHILSCSMNQLYVDKDKGINIANSVWFNKSRTENKKADFSDEFKNIIEEKFYGTAETVTDDNSIEKVNSWVEKQTNGKITNLLSEQDREYRIALVNAIYMKASWINQFDENNTYKETFTDINGNKNEIDFMHQTEQYKYYEDDNRKVICLPYANNTEMVIVVGDSTNIENDIWYGNLDLMYKKVNLAIPKFKIEYSLDFTDILKQMGMKKAFVDNNPDFSPMVKNFDDFIKLQSVKQKAVIEVDEKGTEAAAATISVLVNATSVQEPEEIIEFKANEPFTYYIIDAGETLFAGRYVKCE